MQRVIVQESCLDVLGQDDPAMIHFSHLVALQQYSSCMRFGSSSDLMPLKTVTMPVTPHLLTYSFLILISQHVLKAEITTV